MVAPTLPTAMSPSFTEALDQCIELARQQRRNPATFQQPALAAPVRRVRRSRAVPSAALKASVLEDHNKIIESDADRTLRLIDQELQKTIEEDKPKKRKRVPFREPEYLRHTFVEWRHAKKCVLGSKAQSAMSCQSDFHRLAAPVTTGGFAARKLQCNTPLIAGVQRKLSLIDGLIHSS